MSDFSDKLKALAAPTPHDQVQWRIGATNADKSRGMALAYIDARWVQERLDEALGPDGWQCRYPIVTDKLAVCEIGVWSGIEWLWKADGAGVTDVEAVKGAISDAFKRAGVKWGIAKDLYSIESPWVPLNGRYIADGVDPWAYVGKGQPQHKANPPAPERTAPSNAMTSAAKVIRQMVLEMTDKTGPSGKPYTRIKFADGTFVNCNRADFLRELTHAMDDGVPATVTLVPTPDKKFLNITKVEIVPASEPEDDDAPPF